MKYAGLTHQEVADTLRLESRVEICSGSLPTGNFRGQSPGQESQGVGRAQPAFVLHYGPSSRKAAKLIVAIEDDLDGQSPNAKPTS